MSKTTVCHSECAGGVCLYLDDPILSPKAAAGYLGIASRTLRALKLKRDPMPSTRGEGGWGYRRSTLNRYLRQIAAAKSRLHEGEGSSNLESSEVRHTALAT